MAMIKQAVILAGGMGIRLRPYTYDRPKPMVEVNGRPFAAYLLDELKRNGIEEVVFLLGYLPEKVQEYFGDGLKFGIKVRYSVQPMDDSTGTRVRKAKDLLADRFLLMYCDNFTHMNVDRLFDFHLEKKALMTMTVYTNLYGVTKNNLHLRAGGSVEKYDSKRLEPGLNGVDIGFFIVEKEAVMRIPEKDSWLYDIFPGLISEKKLAGFATNNLYYSLSTPGRLKQTERFLAPRKVIFLDRDGVINKRPAVGDYVKKWDGFTFLPNAFAAFKLLKENGYEVYIISNQAGIARGKMNEGDLFEIHRNMEKEIEANGGKISGIYYCPHGRDDGCLCRKPKPGMLFRAAIDHQIDLSRAIFVGDDPRDEEAGQAAMCQTVLMESDGDLLKIVRNIIKK
jgi:histidinol-phosphate phosphatase family protein